MKNNCSDLGNERTLQCTRLLAESILLYHTMNTTHICRTKAKPLPTTLLVELPLLTFWTFLARTTTRERGVGRQLWNATARGEFVLIAHEKRHALLIGHCATGPPAPTATPPDFFPPCEINHLSRSAPMWRGAGRVPNEWQSKKLTLR